MWNMRASEPMAVNSVLVLYMIAGPQSMRTADRSLVARAIRSPVAWRWKNDCGSRSSWAKRPLRRSTSTSRETVTSTMRCR